MQITTKTGNFKRTFNCQFCGIAKPDNVRYGFPMPDSDIDEDLRRNLERIINERFKGNQRAFSIKLGFNPTYVNAVVRGKKNLGKGNWERILNTLNLTMDQFMKGEKTGHVLNDQERTILGYIRDIESAGSEEMVREAEHYLKYLSDSAKKKDGTGGESASKRVPRSRVKKRA